MQARANQEYALENWLNLWMVLLWRSPMNDTAVIVTVINETKPSRTVVTPLVADNRHKATIVGGIPTTILEDTLVFLIKKWS